MSTIKKTKRKRCRSCRRWFHPHGSAERSQKNCTGKCAAQSRRLLARERRERELQDNRVDERARQRKRRERLREARTPCASVLPVSAQVSRTTLPPQASDLQEVILKNWDKQWRLSRASLRRDLEFLLGVSEESWDKVGQKPPLVTSYPLPITR